MRKCKFYYLKRAVYWKNLLEADSDLPEVQKLQYLLTGAGRHRRKIMIKRRAYLRMKEYEEKGVFVTERVMQEKILNEEAENFQEEYERYKLQSNDMSLQQRKELFEKNETSNN